MSIIRILISIIGAMIFISPNLVAAQQTSATLLLEVQTLRAEIAELRDMVERQQYQLNQLKGAGLNPNQGVAGPNNAAIDTAPPFLDSQTVNNQTEGSQAATQNRFPNTDAYPAPVNSAEQQGDNGLTGGDDGFYQPESVDVRPGNDSNGQATSGAVDQSTTQQPAQQPTTQQPNSNYGEPEFPAESEYPPVEDRSVGGAENSASPAESPSTGAGSDQPLSGSQIPTSQEPVQQPAAATGGVIAIPNSGQAANDPQTQQNTNVPPISATAPAVASQTPEQELYQRGFDLLKQSKHKQAVSVFKEQIELYPQGDASDDAHYWIAESLYVNRDLNDSKQYFKTIIEKYPQSPRLPDALLKTAYIEQEQGNVIESRVLLQEIVYYHPRSNAAISAKNRLAELD